jgi:hypothetical protein
MSPSLLVIEDKSMAMGRVMDKSPEIKLQVMRWIVGKGRLGESFALVYEHRIKKGFMRWIVGKARTGVECTTVHEHRKRSFDALDVHKALFNRSFDDLDGHKVKLNAKPQIMRGIVGKARTGRSYTTAHEYRIKKGFMRGIVGKARTGVECTTVHEHRKRSFDALDVHKALFNRSFDDLDGHKVRF